MKQILTRMALVLGLTLSGHLIHAQTNSDTVNSGSITSTQCVSVDVTQRSTVGIHVEGTWSGTLAPSVAMPGSGATKDSIQVTPGTSSTPQATITANGFYQARIAGTATFFVCGNTVASGTASLTLYASNGVSAPSGGGGGSGTVTSSGSPVSGNVAKFTTSTNIAPAAAADLIALWSGTCDATHFLRGDGACSASGSGTVTSVATTSPISGGTITGTGTISCPTCAVGPGTSTTNHLAKFSGTDGLTLADGGAIPAGTVTSVATTSPLGGGTITSSGTLTCTTCTTSTSPGAGIAHFAGSTQDMTSSAIVNADIANSTIDLTAKVTGALPAANNGVANVSTSGQGYFLMPTGNSTMTAAGTSATLVSTHCSAFQFVLPYAITFTKAALNVVATSNGNHFYVGIYNAAGNTLLRQATFTLGAGTGALGATVSSTSLTPGTYWEMWCADNATVTVTAWGNVTIANTTVLSLNTVRLGTSDQVEAAGVMPATIGTITAATSNMPVVLLEP